MAEDSYPRYIVITLGILNVVTNISFGALAFAAFFISNAGSISVLFRSLRSHIVLVTLGYVIMMSQAIMSLNTTAGWTKALTQRERKYTHLAMELIGAIFAISGISVALSENSYRRDTTAHGGMGIFVLVLTLLSVLGGILHFFFSEKFSVPTRIIHSCLGSLTLLMAFINFGIGLHKVYDGGIAGLYTFILVVAILGVLSSPLISYYKKIVK